MTSPAESRPVVCQVLHALDVGGAEILAARLARQLQDEFRFLFVCLDSAGTLADELARDGFPVHAFQRQPGFDWRLVRQMSRLLRDEQVDVLHAHQYAPFAYCALARGWPARPRIVFTEHGRHQPDYPRPKRIWANKFLMGRNDQAIAVGEAVRQALLQYEGLPPLRVTVIYNGIDLLRFDPQAPLRDTVRKELKLSADDFVLMQVARLDYLKDHGTSLQTVALLKSAGLPVKLVIVGDGPERVKIEKQHAELQLGDSVRMLGQRSDIPRLIQAADALLLTSISEGIPLTLIEGMAAGLPIVATDVGGVSEVVEQEVTGLLAPPRNPQQLSAQIRRLMSDPELRIRYGQAGRQRAERLFSEPEMHRQYREAYRRVT
jgi:glycosyltransferase involved in cell wall biosynthesis